MYRMDQLHSPYIAHAPGEPIAVFEGPADLVEGSRRYSVQASATVGFSPSPQTFISARGESGPAIEQDVSFEVQIPHQEHPVTPSHVRIRWDGTAGTRFELDGQLQEPVKPATPIVLSSVRFHLLNFPDFWWVTGIHEGRVGPLELSFGEWLLTIEGVTDVQEKRKESRRSRSYLITHVAELKRSDGDCFTTSDWFELDPFFYYCLSLCAGLRCPPAVVDGLDANSNVVWRDVALGRLGHDRPHSHWFPRPYPTHVQDLIAGLWTRWGDADKREATERACEWYWEAVDRGSVIETRLVLAQVALELLSWVIMAEETERLSVGGFKSLPAADRMSLLANQLQVSPLVPAHFAELVSAAKANNWASAPQAIAEIRNRIIHPEKKGRTLVTALDWEVKYQATEWAVWLIELALLWVGGYNGRYDSRIAEENQSFPFVPWVDPTQAGAGPNAVA
jgi:hypothetical protein